MGRRPRAGAPAAALPEAPYWVFVCNPKRWAIDRFLERGIERDTWGVRKHDRHRFAPGQLAIVRVGVDRRSAKQRKGKPPLASGIYALCEIESEAFPSTGAADEYWSPNEKPQFGKPTVRIRYLRSYPTAPLTIERLRAEYPKLSKLLLNGFQGSSFPISADDFHAVMELLGEDAETLPDIASTAIDVGKTLTELEKKYRTASPEVKEGISRRLERGPIGELVKKANSYKCQLCMALGQNPIGFAKKKGRHLCRGSPREPRCQDATWGVVRVKRDDALREPSSRDSLWMPRGQHQREHLRCANRQEGRSRDALFGVRRTCKLSRLKRRGSPRRCPPTRWSVEP
jgi:predicted RNA-binding protein with PUA-like domain